MDIIHQFTAELKAKLKARRAAIAEAVAIGKATDWADYRHRTGQVKSLDHAISEIDALTERQEIRE